MTQATPYTKTVDLTEYATANPQAPFPPAQLDSQLAAIATFSQEIQNNLALLQNDVGGLRGNTVTPDTLALATLLLVGGTGFTPRGAWITGRAYAVKDIVTQDNGIYFVVTAHTSGTFATDLAAGRLMQIGSNVIDSSNAGLVSFAPNGGLLTALTVQAVLIQVQGFLTTLINENAARAGDITAVNAEIDSNKALNDSEHLAIYDAIATANSRPPAVVAKIEKNNAQTIANGATAKILFNSVVIGSSRFSTANARYTYNDADAALAFPIEYVEVYAQVLMDNISGTNAFILYIYKNGAAIHRAVTRNGASGLPESISISAVVDLAFGDYIEIFLMNATAASRSLDITTGATFVTFKTLEYGV